MGWEATLDFDGKLWRYVLRCTAQRVLHKVLYQKRDRFGYAFIRDWQPESNAYSVKQQDFGLPAQEARKVRPNVSLIAWAAQYGVPLAVRMAAPYVVTNVNVFGRMPMGEQSMQVAARHFSGRPVQRERMNRLLASWDMGLAGVELQEIPVNAPQETTLKVWWPFGKHRSHGVDF